jgi:hypothetical protein
MPGLLGAMNRGIEINLPAARRSSSVNSGTWQAAARP